MAFTVELKREDDGGWLAEVVELPGVLAYGQTSDEAIVKAQALALFVLADRLEHGDGAPEFVTISLLRHGSMVVSEREARSRQAGYASAGVNVNPALIRM